MEICNNKEPTKGALFMKVYKDELERLEKEYNYKFFLQGTRLLIYMH